jgi:hypothetical protein
MVEKRNAYRILVGSPEGKGPLGRPRCTWVHNTKMDLGEIGWGGVEWTDLVQDMDQWRALVNMVINLQEPGHTDKFLSNCTTAGLLRRAQLHRDSLFYDFLSEVFCVFNSATTVVKQVTYDIIIHGSKV